MTPVPAVGAPVVVSGGHAAAHAPLHVLVSLYLFEADKSSTSTCTGACAAAWPPLTTTGAPTAGTGVKASLLGTSKRDDGKMEVTYNGHPLYYFANDSAPGDIKGQGVDAFGAEWYAVSPEGKTAEGGES